MLHLKRTLSAIQEPELAAYGRRLLQAFEQEQVPEAPSAASASSGLLEPLTSQEQRVLRLLAEGASNILGKLGAANRTQAIMRARQYGLL